MNEDLTFWKNALMKGFVTGGFTFFSILATLGVSEALEPSVVAGGLYIFAEAIKYYNIQPNKKVLNKTYNFII